MPSANPYMLGAARAPAQDAFHTDGLMPRCFRRANPGKQKIEDMNAMLCGVEVRVSMSEHIWFTGVITEVLPGRARHSSHSVHDYDAPRALVHVKSYVEEKWCDKLGRFVEGIPRDISGFFDAFSWASIMLNDEEEGGRFMKSFDLIRTAQSRPSGFGLVELPSSFARYNNLSGCKFVHAHLRRSS